MPPKLKAFLQAWLINTLAVLVAAHVVSGIKYDNVTALLVATLLLGVLNAVVRPFLLVLSLPLLLLTLGLFALVVNAGLLYFVGSLVKGFHVPTFWDACKGAMVTAVISILLNSLTGTGSTRVKASAKVRRGDRDGGGDGPMIDV
jgi:putative membrane protein